MPRRKRKIQHIKYEKAAKIHSVSKHNLFEEGGGKDMEMKHSINQARKKSM
jgi:hypothetical protein